MKKFVVFVVLAMVVIGSLFAQSANNDRRIVGTWTDIEGYTWVFSADEKLTYDSKEIRYAVTDTKLAIMVAGFNGNGVQIYDISISADGKTLILTGGSSLPNWILAGPGVRTNWLSKK
jgi:dipeptidyl aminopeptidase/acylaminoacyl peptidase